MTEQESWVDVCVGLGACFFTAMILWVAVALVVAP